MIELADVDVAGYHFLLLKPGDRVQKESYNIDAKINGAYIVMGLLYGGGDMDKTILISTRCGQDSDCNPANAAGILGTDSLSAPQHVLEESYCAWDCEFSLRGLQRNPDFGFSTDEVVSPGKTLDSLTVSLQNSTGQKSAVLVTADASGVLWAPPSPGGLAIDPAVISRAPITFPSLQPTLGTRTAFQVHMPIPDSLMGQPVEIVFDLFDNQDLIASLGFFTDIVIVPEPSVCTFAVCGIWLILWRRKRIMK